MKKLLIIHIILFLIYNSGCSYDGPIYINDIEVYQNDNLIESNLKYFDGRVWVLYNNQKPTKEKIYLSVDISSNEDILIVFNIYSPKLTVNEMKLTLNYNTFTNTNEGGWATVLNKDGDYTKCTFLIDDFTNDFNTITSYGWLTNQGPKYMGSKAMSSNYTLWGVNINLIT